MHVQVGCLPDSRSNFFTGHRELSTLVHFTEKTKRKIDLVLDLGVNSTQALLLAVDQHGAGHGVEDSLFKVFRLKIRVRPEGDALAFILTAAVLEEKRMREHAQEVSGPALVIFSILLETAKYLRMSDEIGEMLFFDSCLRRGQGLAIHGDQSPEETITRFNDFFCPQMTAGARRALLGEIDEPPAIIQGRALVLGHFADKLVRSCLRIHLSRKPGDAQGKLKGRCDGPARSEATMAIRERNRNPPILLPAREPAFLQEKQITGR
jgi:hypothetical protein